MCFFSLVNFMNGSPAILKSTVGMKFGGGFEESESSRLWLSHDFSSNAVTKCKHISTVKR